MGMASGRPTKALNLTPQEKEKLGMLARRPKSSQAIAMRARIVLGCAEGMSNGAVANKLWHAQGEQSADLVGTSPTLSRPLHSHQRQLAELGGAIVRRGDGTMRTPRQPYHGSLAGKSHARISGSAQPRSQAVCVDSRRRPDFGQSRETL